MQSVLDVVFEFFEFMAVGAVTLWTAWYLLSVWLPLRAAVIQYTVKSRLWKGIAQGLRTPSENRPIAWVGVALLLGVVYYAGALTNVAAYFLMEPVHAHIIRNTTHEPKNTSSVPIVFSTSAPIALPEVFWLPTRLSTSENHLETQGKDLAARGKDLTAQLRVVAKEPTAADRLGRLLKWSRLIRGTATLGLVVAALSLIRVFWAIAISLLLVVPITVPCGRWLYRVVIDDKPSTKPNGVPNTSSEAELKEKKLLLSQTRTRTGYPGLAFVVLGTAAYAISLKLFVVVEMQYHDIVKLLDLMR